MRDTIETVLIVIAGAIMSVLALIVLMMPVWLPAVVIVWVVKLIIAG